MSRTPAMPAEVGEILLNHPATPWRHVRRLADKANGGAANVLLLGPPGTGKEFVARVIHALSSRRDGPFLTLRSETCSLADFTRKLLGEGKQRGLLADARQGTLFLDGAGWMTAEVQERLALVPEARLVLATDGPMSVLLRDPRFGGAVFHRLRMFPITLPELAKCPEVLPELVREFVYFHARKAGKTVDRIPPTTMQALAAWAWPGNLPELNGFIQRAVRQTAGGTLDAPLDDLVAAPASGPVRGTMEAVEREHILRTLRACSGVVTTAAARLGLPRTTLNARIKKLAIQRGEY
jgi:formate hydrogenlyase transcriptional activator